MDINNVYVRDAILYYTSIIQSNNISIVTIRKQVNS